MACRDTKKAEEAAADIVSELSSESRGEIDIKRLDLSSLKSVRVFSEEVLTQERHIHILVNNAGESTDLSYIF